MTHLLPRGLKSERLWRWIVLCFLWWIESSLDPKLTLPFRLNHSLIPIRFLLRFGSFTDMLTLNTWTLSSLTRSSLSFVALFIYSVIIYNSSNNNAVFLFFCLLPLWEMMLSFVFMSFFWVFFFVYIMVILLRLFGFGCTVSYFLWSKKSFLMPPMVEEVRFSYASYGRRKASLCLIRRGFTCAGFSLFYNFTIFFLVGLILGESSINIVVMQPGLAPFR